MEERPKQLLSAGVAVVDRFSTVGEAYAGVVRRVLDHGAVTEGVTDPASVGSEFGQTQRPTRELIGYAFSIEDSAIGLASSAARRPDLAFCFGHLAWVLSGSDDVDFIRYYNPRGEIFSDDGNALRGAVGPRLGRDRSGLARVVDQLRRDPTSRRAILPLLYLDDVSVQSRDVPCALGLQFVVRSGSLVAIAFMRSQSALMILPYDIFLFQALQHYVAAALGLPAGAYVHVAGSIHIYEDEFAVARETLMAAPATINMLPMSDGSSIADSVLADEAGIRTAVCRNDSEAIRRRIAVETRPARTLWDEMRLTFLFKAAWTLGLAADLNRVQQLLSPAALDVLAIRYG